MKANLPGHYARLVEGGKKHCMHHGVPVNLALLTLYHPFCGFLLGIFVPSVCHSVLDIRIVD